MGPAGVIVIRPHDDVTVFKVLQDLGPRRSGRSGYGTDCDKPMLAQGIGSLFTLR